MQQYYVIETLAHNAHKVMHLSIPVCRSIHDVKATDMGRYCNHEWYSVCSPLSEIALFHFVPGADTVRFKAEVNFDGREVARAHVEKLNLENSLRVGT